MVDYTGRTLAELAEGINQTDSAIQRCQTGPSVVNETPIGHKPDRNPAPQRAPD